MWVYPYLSKETLGIVECLYCKLFLRRFYQTVFAVNFYNGASRLDSTKVNAYQFNYYNKPVNPCTV